MSTRQAALACRGEWRIVDHLLSILQSVLLLLTMVDWIACAAMTDIPFGEYFTVEARWDIIAAPPAPDGTPCSRVRQLPTALQRQS